MSESGKRILEFSFYSKLLFSYWNWHVLKNKQEKFLFLPNKLSRKTLFWAYFDEDKWKSGFCLDIRIQDIYIIQGVQESLCLGPELMCMCTVFLKFLGYCFKESFSHVKISFQCNMYRKNSFKSINLLKMIKFIICLQLLHFQTKFMDITN